MKKLIRFFFSFLSSEKKKSSKGSEIIDPVYHFFVHEKAAEKKRVYDRALKAADNDQKEMLKQFEVNKKRLSSPL